VIGQAGVLNVLVTASTGQANAALAKTSAQFKETAGAAETSSAAASRAWRGVAVGLGLVGIAAGKLSVDFNKKMTLIETQAGAPAGEIDKLKNKVLDLSKQSVFAPSALADGLFHIESAGFHGVKAMQALNAAQKLATVGGSDLESTTYALVSALETGIKGASNMTTAVGTMNAIVGHGDMRMEDFTSALSTGILPVAKSFGLSLRDVGSALDTMTARGTPAQAAATRLRMTFSLLGAQTATATKVLGQLGIKQGQLGEVMQHQGLIPALQLLSNHLQQAGDKAHQAQAITAAFGGGRTSAGIMTLIQNLGDVRQRYDEIGKSSGDFNKNFREASSTTAAQFQRAWATIQADLIQLGDYLAGPAARAATIFAGAISAIPNVLNAIPGDIKTLLGALLALRIGWAVFGGMIGKVVGSSLMTSLGAMLGRTTLGIWAYSLATDMMAALGGALPIAIGAIGIGDIVLSAVKGDMGGVAAKTTGLAIGAAIGTFIEPGIGTVIGGGIGAIAGGLFGNLLGGSTQAEHVMEKVRKEAHGVKDAFSGAKSAISSYGRATHAVNKAHQRVHDTTVSVHKAEKNYQNVLEHNLSTSMPAIRAEQRLKDATLGHARAIKSLHNAEKVQGAQRNFLVHQLSFEYDRTRQLNQQLKQQVRHLQAHFLAAQASGASDAKLQRINDKWKKATHEQSNAQNKQNKLLVQASQQVGPKFAKSMQRGKLASQNLGISAHNLGQSIRVYGREVGPAIDEQANWTRGLHQSKQAIDPLGNVFKKNLINPFKDTHQQAPKAGQDIVDFTGHVQDLGHKTPPATHQARRSIDDLGTAIQKFQQQSAQNITQYVNVFGGGMGAQASDFNQIARGLGGGVSPIKYQAKKVKGKRTGGFFNVPGMGSGDKVPLHIGGELRGLLEPGELVGIVNRRAASAVNDINSQIGRFAGGGIVSLLPGVNMTQGSEPIIKGDLGKFSALEGKPVFVISGYRSPAHSVAVGGFANDPHTQGLAADIGLGSPTLASMMSLGLEGALNRAGLHRPYYPPSTAEANHVELLGGGAKGNFAVPKVALEKMTGPAGGYLTAGNVALKTINTAMNKYIQQHAMTGGLAGMNVPTGPIVQMAKAMVSNIWGMGQWPPYESVEMQEAGFDPTAVNPSSGAAGLAQALPPTKYPPGAWPYHGLESAKLQLGWMMQYIKSTYGNPAGAWAHEQAIGWYRKGGVLGMAKGGTLHLPKFLHHLSHVTNKGKRKQVMHRLLDKIKGVGLNDHLIKNIHKWDEAYQTYDDLAQRAAAISGDTGAAAKVTGADGTYDQAGWLKKELNALWRLRGYMIQGQDQVKKIKDQIEREQKQAKKLYKEIHKDFKKTKHQIDKIRGKGDLNKQDLKDMRDQEKKANKRIQQLQNKKHLTPADQRELKNLKEANKLRERMLSNKKKPMNQRVQDLLDALGKDQQSRQVRMTALRGNKGIMPALRDQRGKIGGALQNFTTLDDIQGRGSPHMLNTKLRSPVDTRFGGDILDVQIQLRDLASPAGLSGLNASDLAEFAKLVRVGAFATDQFGTMPTFHKGGIVGRPGTSSADVIATIQKGEGYVDARTMKQGGRGQNVSVGVILYADEDRALVDVNGEQFKVAVDRRHKKAEKDREHRVYRQQRAGARMPS
jgi:TP901 family phage tail tape measure protein